LYVPERVDSRGGIIALRKPWYEILDRERYAGLLVVDEIEPFFEEIETNEDMIHTHDPEEAFSFLVPSELINYWQGGFRENAEFEKEHLNILDLPPIDDAAIIVPMIKFSSSVEGGGPYSQSYVPVWLDGAQSKLYL